MTPVNETYRQFIPPMAKHAVMRSSRLRMLARHAQNALGRLPRDVFVALASILIVGFALALWSLSLAKRDALLSTEVERLDREWKALSSDLNDAHRMHLHVTTFLGKVRQVAEENKSGQWTPALHSIAASAGPDIELRVINVWKKPGDAGARLVRIEGVSTGAEPRLVADRFSRQLQDELKRCFQIGEGCRFERINDEPASPADDPGQRKAAFTIVATIGAALPSQTPAPLKN